MKKHSVRDLLISGIFFAGFLCGILFVTLWGDTYLRDCDVLNMDSLQMICRTEVDARALFFYVLSARGKCCLLFWLLGYTAAGIPAMLFALGCLGFSAGVFGCLAVIHLHMTGVLFFLAALLPQAILYAPMIWIAAGSIYDRGIRRFQKGRYQESLYRPDNGARRTFLCLALFLAGAFLESCANPWVLKKTVTYFFFS